MCSIIFVAYIFVLNCYAMSEKRGMEIKTFMKEKEKDNKKYT